MNRGEYEREITLQTYSLELIGPARHYPDGHLIGAQITRSYLDEVEENLSDLLPLHYRVRIRDWDTEEEKPA